jgi:hypothetical protein
MSLRSKRGGIIAIWIFVVMVVVTCLTTMFFFIQSSQGSSKSFQAVSSGFYFHAEKERAETILQVYGEQLIFTSYAKTMDEISRRDLSGCVADRTRFILMDGSDSLVREYPKIFSDSLVFNSKDVLIPYSDSLNVAKLKEASKDLSMVFDGENVLIKIYNYETSYVAEGISSNYMFDVAHDTSFEKLGLISLKSISLAKEKCIMADKSYDEDCIKNYFKDYDIAKYSGANCQNLQVFVFTSKNSYFFDDTLSKISFGVILSDEILPTNPLSGNTILIR